MLVTLIIILLLILAFRFGYKRGLLMTLMSAVGYIVVFLLAIFLAKPMGIALSGALPALCKNVDFSTVFYQVLAFWIIAIVGSIIYRVVAKTVNGITKLPLISQLNAFAGAALSTILMYIVIFFGLLLMSAWPNSNVQQSVHESNVAQWILTKTPLFSQNIFDNISN
nr:CvpA family protein [uncultured Ligilactobacillus sp.]